MSDTHETRRENKKGRKYPGQKEGERLLSFLNGELDPRLSAEQAARIKRLIDSVLELKSFADYSPAVRKNPVITERIWALQEDISRQLQHYPKQHYVLWTGKGVEAAEGPPMGAELQEYEAVSGLLFLVQKSRLDNLRKCANTACDRWFIAKFSHQEHCPGGKCQQSDYRATPEFKEKRNEWARNHYREFLSSNRSSRKEGKRDGKR